MPFPRIGKLDQDEKRYLLMVTWPAKELGRSVTDAQSSLSRGAMGQGETNETSKNICAKSIPVSVSQLVWSFTTISQIIHK